MDREVKARLGQEDDKLPERTKRGLTRVVKNSELAKGRPTEANRYLFVSIAKKYKIYHLAIEIG